jgi:3,4-dihydroxy 2-butanone 4-phosphate synthase/GTP cyclohydrolase II
MNSLLSSQASQEYPPQPMCPQLPTEEQALQTWQIQQNAFDIHKFMSEPDASLEEETFKDYSSVEDALAAIARGEMIILADDEDRENEGDLVCAAEKATPELINFMAQEGRGLICVTLTQARCQALNLAPMVVHNNDPFGTAFTVSVDAHPKYGVTTGISASDRATTIQLCAAETTVPDDLRRPGHIFPLAAKPGGVLERVGQTEGSVDLARLAGLKPAGVICEILNPDGTMARRESLKAFAQKHRLPMITVAQLIAYRLKHETMVEQVAKAHLPTAYGTFDLMVYKNLLDNTEHIALVKGAIGEEAQDPSRPETLPLVRVHSECLTGDVLGSLRCDCGPQLEAALSAIEAHGKGVLVYMRNHEGRGIGLVNKIKAYSLQEKGLDTVEANLEMGFPPDLRHYGVGAQILLHLGVRVFTLLTNNPRKIKGLDGYGLTVAGRQPLHITPNEENQKYLTTKRLKLGHLM